MKFISHRGNIDGPNPEWENDPSRIEDVLNKGYDVEIDVWKIGAKLFLGHDGPQFPIDYSFIKNESLLCHAKNLEALEYMLKMDDVHCFWHQEDHYTITSNGYIVSYPGYAVTPKTICMRPETQSYTQLYGSAYAICSDYVEIFK
jgi:hypothetical protein